MDDIQILQLENKALRLQNERLKDELAILKRYRQLIQRSTEIANGIGRVTEDELGLAVTIFGA